MVNCYFIVIDSDDNVFGHYQHGAVSAFEGGYDDKMFLFTLNSNGRCDVKRFNSVSKFTFTFIQDSDFDYYTCGCEYECCYNISKIGVNSSTIENKIVEVFEGVEMTIFTGKSDSFTTKRIIVIEMK